MYTTPNQYLLKTVRGGEEDRQNGYLFQHQNKAVLLAGNLSSALEDLPAGRHLAEQARRVCACARCNMEVIRTPPLKSYKRRSNRPH